MSGGGADTAFARYDATVRSPVAPMHGEPTVTSPMVSQQLAGHTVEVLEESGDWVRACGPDHYDAWIHRGFLTKAPHRTARQSHHAARVSLGCVTRTGHAEKRALPLRAVLSPDEIVVSGEVVDSPHLSERFPLTGEAIARSAQAYFEGTSYLWGGVTPWGADCSGLVQSVFALHGRFLPRDAWQQAELGTSIETDASFRSLRAADLLFFSDRADRRVTHVGIAMGDSRMVHLSLGRGGYAVERLDDANDVYLGRLRASFLFAKRLLG